MPFLYVPHRAPLPRLLCRGRPRAFVLCATAASAAALLLLCTAMLLCYSAAAAAAAASNVCDMFSLLTPMTKVVEPNPCRLCVFASQH